MANNVIPVGYISRREALKLGATSKATLERRVRAGRLDSKLIPRVGKSKERVYKAADVARLKEERERRALALPPSALVRKPSSGVPSEFFHELVKLMRELALDHQQQKRQLAMPEPKPQKPAVPVEQKLWLSPAEAKAYSGLTRNDLRKLVRDDALAVRGSGRGLRIQRKSLEEFEG
jgi:hypothetical protein